MHLNIEIESMPFFDQWSRYGKLKRIAELWEAPIERKIRFKSLPRTVQKFRIFKSKSKKRVKNIITLSEADLQSNILVFDFHCSDDGFDIKRTTVLLVESAMFDLPKFHVEPKSAISLLAKLFFIEESQFDKFPEFVQHYKVKGNDVDSIDYVMKRELLEYLSVETKWNIEGDENYLLFYKKNKTVRPENLETFKEACLDMSRWIMLSDSNDYV